MAFIAPKHSDEVHPKTKVTLEFPDHFSLEGEVMNVPSYADRTPMAFQNPMATRENKLVVIIEFKEEVPEKHRVFGLHVDVDLHK